MKPIFQKGIIKTVVLMFITAIFVSASVYHFIIKTAKEVSVQNQELLVEIAMQNADSIKDTVYMYLDRIEAVANVIGSQKNLSTDTILNILSIEADRSSFVRMGYATYDGIAQTTDGKTFSISDRDFFRTALYGQSNVSNRLEDKLGGDYINVYAVPLFHNGGISGVIFATNDSETFSSVLSTPTFGGEGLSYVITKDGFPIVFPGANTNSYYSLSEIIREENGYEKFLPMVENLQQGLNGFIEYSINNDEKFSAYCKIGVNDWYAVTTVPKKIVSGITDRLISRNILIVSFTTLMFIGLIIFILLQNRKVRRGLEQVAYYDELTNFPNFNAFKENVQMVLDKSHNKQFVFVKLDVDNFKLINDRYDFQTGDRVLKNIALAINNALNGTNEQFARINTDEFIIIFNFKTVEELKAIRHNFKKHFFKLMGPEFDFFVKFPTGIYTTDIDEDLFSQIYEKVNYAHRKAKQRTEKFDLNAFYYDDRTKAEAIKETEIEGKMAAALSNEEFIVFLQPKFELKSEKIIAAEALVRWQTSNGDLISPGEFVPLFERNGLIVKLDMYMFEHVCHLISDWIDKGEPIVTISVNFSRLHLTNPNFINELVSISEKYRTPRKYIEIELTETIVFENEDMLANIINKIHSAGFSFSMDDFGTGYSSLGLLKSLPVDVIKMDRSFFTNNKYPEKAKTVVSSVMLMAKNLNIYTVAEGVESREQIDFLREVGCDIAQGFYFAKPMPIEQFSQLLKNQNLQDTSY